jgi:hypothetical protein
VPYNRPEETIHSEAFVCARIGCAGTLRGCSLSSDCQPTCLATSQAAGKYKGKVKKRAARREHVIKNRIPKDMLDDVFRD